MKLLKQLSARISDDALAGKIAGNIIGNQRKLAGYLNQRARKVSNKGLVILLIAFCILFGGYCACLIFKACI